MIINIFDLDGTVVDSSHRLTHRTDGSIDLAAWREKETKEFIFQDTVLPLANHWLQCLDRGEQIVICTVRPMKDADFAFLLYHRMYHHLCLAGKDVLNEKPATRKARQLRQLVNNNPWADKFVFWEDNPGIRAAVSKIQEIEVLDPATINAV